MPFLIREPVRRNPSESHGNDCLEAKIQDLPLLTSLQGGILAEFDEKQEFQESDEGQGSSEYC